MAGCLNRNIVARRHCAGRLARKEGAVSTARTGSIVIALAMSLLLTAPPLALAEVLSYGYDSAGRLISVQHDDGTTIDYVYDNLGNLLQKATRLPGEPANNPPSAVTLGLGDGSADIVVPLINCTQSRINCQSDYNL